MSDKIKIVEGRRRRPTLVLTDDVAMALETERARLSAELGFEVGAVQTIAWMLKRVREVRMLPAIVPVDPRVVGVDYTALNNEVIQFMRNNQKINAIKRVREVTQMGLKEAKDYVEQGFEMYRPKPLP